MSDTFSDDRPIDDAPGPPIDVAYVIPASAYDSIDTDEELTRDGGAESISTMQTSMVDLDPALRAIDELGRHLHAKIDALTTAFDREIRAEGTREKVVDRLHAELQDYKQDLLLNVMRPVFVDLIQLHDDIGKMGASYLEGGGPDRSAASAEFDKIRQGIEDILYRQGVEPFVTDGDAFDARRQRAVSTVATTDESLARKVAERHRKGFVTGQKVIRPEVVSVYVYKPEPSAVASSPRPEIDANSRVP
jgi:molecular chaperone GrpE